MFKKRHFFHKWSGWVPTVKLNAMGDTQSYRVCTVCGKREDATFFRYF
jgi:hypothetical protein